MTAHVPHSRSNVRLAFFCAGLALSVMHVGCAQPPSPPTPAALHRLLISGGLDSLRLGVAHEVQRQMAIDLRGTTIQMISNKEIFTAAMPEHYETDMPLTLVDLQELGKLLRVDMIVALAIVHADGAVQVELTLVAPLGAAPRSLVRTSAQSARALGPELARTIRADSAYRRLRAGHE